MNYETLSNLMIGRTQFETDMGFLVKSQIYGLSITLNDHPFYQMVIFHSNGEVFINYNFLIRDRIVQAIDAHTEFIASPYKRGIVVCHMTQQQGIFFPGPTSRYKYTEGKWRA